MAACRPRAALLVLLAVCVACASGRLAAARPDSDLAAAAAAGPLVRLVGRFFPGDNGAGGALPQLFTWSGASASVAFEGATSVTVSFDGRMSSLPKEHEQTRAVKKDSTFPWGFFQFELDGVKVGVGEITASKPQLKWKLIVSPGPHVLTITKLSEARYGAAWLQSIALPAGGRFLPPPPSPGMLSGRGMLFLGDSFTAGWGNTEGRSCKGADAHNMNTLLAYSGLTARHFNADAQILAWSGTGLLTYAKRYQTSWPQWKVEAAAPLGTQFLLRADALSPSSRYNLAAFQPQVVVLAMGTNDFLEKAGTRNNRAPPYGLPNLKAWTDGYLAVARELRRAYPSAAIINLVWPLEQLTAGVLTREQATKYQQWMAAAFARLQFAGVGNVHLLQLSGAGLDSRSWCGAHPDVAAHALLAPQLESFVRGILPSWK
ncbi:endo-1,4-beta- isoform A [Chlorella sorokiniana]|uniref:Endo-1,4-beta-isoform A n=1 Tax=Chlorella sorokiniana TaxID=3076 RepID=A0A2P6TRK1_CHLSO|nr:endo-1,4-beta- isoform A [Chlorella sorokiniana]|eukprot:PRW56696.1 endo-1,4-beta- isoform A [Chlorella sorokiniana]